MIDFIFKCQKENLSFRVLIQIELCNSSYIVNSFGCSLLKKFVVFFFFKKVLILMSIYCMKIVQYENISFLLLLFVLNFSLLYDILVFIWLLMIYAGVSFWVTTLFFILLSYYTIYDSGLFVVFDFIFDSLEKKTRESLLWKGTYKQMYWHNIQFMDVS